MNALVQRFCYVYSEKVFNTTWIILEYGRIRESLLLNSPNLDLLRRAHHVHIAWQREMSLETQPVPAAVVFDQFETFWYDVVKSLMREIYNFTQLRFLGLT